MVAPFKFDVAVLGAGSAGCCAAIAAARAGAHTALIERLAFPGGTSTAVLDTFYAFFTSGEEPQKVVSGIPDEPVHRLSMRDKVFIRKGHSGVGYTYDPETLKLVWAELLREAGVTVLLHTFLCGVVVDGAGTVRSVQIAGKAGLDTLEAQSFVDASGDADLIALAQGQVLSDVERRQPATLTFRMAPVDIRLFQAEGRPRFRELVRRGRAAGYELNGESGSLHRSGNEGVVLVAATRLGPPDLGDPREPGRLELEGLQQVDEWCHFLREFMPGFAKAEISAIGAMTGVRETRRILGHYVLQEDDVVHGKQFRDQIARCGAPIEDLSPSDTRWHHVEEGGAYGIPWRCLIPAGLRRTCVAGRCLSATHAAHASARSMGTCMALGQAAGTAAAMAAEVGIDVGAVDADILRRRLIVQGADVGQQGETSQ